MCVCVACCVLRSARACAVFVCFVNSGSKGRKVSLAVYAEDDSNDLSDLGIGTSSASGKSSLSEDFDNHSVLVSVQIATMGFYSGVSMCGFYWVECAPCP